MNFELCHLSGTMLGCKYIKTFQEKENSSLFPPVWEWIWLGGEHKQKVKETKPWLWNNKLQHNWPHGNCSLHSGANGRFKKSLKLRLLTVPAGIKTIKPCFCSTCWLQFSSAPRFGFKNVASLIFPCISNPHSRPHHTSLELLLPAEEERERKKKRGFHHCATACIQTRSEGNSHKLTQKYPRLWEMILPSADRVKWIWVSA